MGSAADNVDAGPAGPAERNPTQATSRAAAGPRAADSVRAGIAVGLVSGLTYANALANRFALDDDDIVRDNALIHHVSGTWRAFTHSYWPLTAGAGQYRPLTVATFAADWVVSGGSPVWMHAVNVFMHVAMCLLVWRLLTELTSRGGALVGALLFAVHPVHVEAVASLVGRADVLCAVCTLAALLAHRRGRWVAVPLYAAALAAKESGVVFIGLAVASDLLIAGPAAAYALHEVPPMDAPRSMRPTRWLYGCYALVTGGYAGLLVVLFRDQPFVRVAALWQHASLGERWLTALTLVPEYIRLLVFPVRLHVEYTPRVIEIARGVTSGVVLGAALTAAVVALGVKARRRAPPIAFAIAAMACAIAPVANVFFPSGIVVAERTLYLASVAVAIGAAWLWDRALAARDGLGGDRRDVSRARSTGGRGAPLLAGLVLGALAIRTWTRTPIWRSDKSVMIASLLGEPESYVAHERAADVLYRSGDVDGAMREYAVARSLYPYDPMLYQGPAALLVARDPGGAPAAEALLDSARAIDPSPYADAMRRAWVRYAAKDYRGSIMWARAAYLMSRDSVDAVMVLTQAAQQIDDVSDATAAFRLALSDHPRNRALHRSYGAMLTAAGDSAGARREAALADN